MTGAAILLVVAMGLLAWTPGQTPAGRLLGLHPQVDGEVAPSRRSVVSRLPIPVIALALGLAVMLLVGGWPGLLGGTGIAVVVVRVVPRLESAATRRRRTDLALQVPQVVDLLAACLAAGAPVEASVAAVARAVDEPAADVLRQVAAQLRLGAAPSTAWSAAATEPSFAPLAAAVERSLDSGAPLADALPAVADDLRARRRADLEIATRKVGVRLTAPLGLAFLPAFVLLGVVPVVASLMTGVLAQ